MKFIIECGQCKKGELHEYSIAKCGIYQDYSSLSIHLHASKIIIICVKTVECLTFKRIGLKINYPSKICDYSVAPLFMQLISVDSGFKTFLQL